VEFYDDFCNWIVTRNKYLTKISDVTVNNINRSCIGAIAMQLVFVGNKIMLECNLCQYTLIDFPPMLSLTWDLFISLTV